MYNPNVTPYTPGNVDDTTRMLIGLNQKGQLQQYVQQHSSDPNLVALALYVNNLDSAVRGQQAQQQAQQMQGQPTVVEEQIAKMAPQQLPENVGIGALPAPNIEGFADGGIVGYADGGGMGYNPASGPAGRLAYDNEPVLRMADGGIVAFADGGVLGDIPGMTQSDLYKKAVEKAQAGQPLSSIEKALLFASAPLAAAADVAASPINFLRRNIRNPLDTSPMPSYTPAMDARAQALGLGEAAPAAAAAPATMSDMPQSTFKGYGDTADIDQMLAWGAKQKAAPPSTERPPAPPAPRAAAPAAQPQGIADIVRAAEEQFGTKEPEFNRAAALAEKEKYMGVHPAKAQMERLAKLDEMAAAEREDAKGFAILRAGLGMMASKSPMGLVGIGEGAQAGLTDYQAALKDLKAAEMDRAKQRATAENAMYAAKEGNWDDVDKRYDNYMNRREKASEKMMSLYGTLTSTQMQGQTSRDVANISAAAHREGAAAQREATAAYREAALEQRQMAMVEQIRKNIEARLSPMILDQNERAAAVERQLQIELQRYPALAKYAGTPGDTGAGGAQLRYNPKTGKIE